MIELSITAKPAVSMPPATPVSGAAPGGFARTLDALSDGPPARPDMVDPRHDDAARGKKLPVAAADPTDEPTAAALPSPAAPAKAASPRRAVKPGPQPILPPDPPVIAAIARDTPSSDDDKGPASDDAAPDDKAAAKASPATPSIVAVPIAFAPPPAAPVPDTAPLVARGTTRAIANVSFSPALRSPGAPGAPGAVPDASAPGSASPANADAAHAPATTTATASGLTALPSHVELLDAGTAKAATNTATDTAGITASRIATPDQTPRFALAPATTAPVTPSVPAAVTVQPARQAFAAALAAFSARVATHDDDDADDAYQPIAGLAAPTGDTLIQAAVQQVADSSQSALDPRHDQGLNGMIDHIEMLRDDANARDTRIRLTPDALGTVDVAVRRDGAAVHVRFSSPNEATRAVLGDAQPRLAALAEARGVRIAGSSVDSGASGHWGGNAQPQPQPNGAAVIPASAPRSTATDADTEPMTDQRLA